MITVRHERAGEQRPKISVQEAERQNASYVAHTGSGKKGADMWPPRRPHQARGSHLRPLMSRRKGGKVSPRSRRPIVGKYHQGVLRPENCLCFQGFKLHRKEPPERVDRLHTRPRGSKPSQMPAHFPFSVTAGATDGAKTRQAIPHRGQGQTREK